MKIKRRITSAKNAVSFLTLPAGRILRTLYKPIRNSWYKVPVLQKGVVYVIWCIRLSFIVIILG
jgi:hypothetical protein